ncbi:uncharacterized protein LOC115695858 [Cannabis sativa]|nr:uncharacterized protein LOC115695858 [Cannabis sativa]
MENFDDQQELVGKIREAMQQNWHEVVRLYETDPNAQSTKISTSGYTALHVAVADGKDDIVYKLVASIKSHISTIISEDMTKSSLPSSYQDYYEDDNRDVMMFRTEVEQVANASSSPLGIQNEKGNTALHLAAAIGNVPMCISIMSSLDLDQDYYRSLIEIKNEKGETPLFLAAKHGKKNAFLYLNSFLMMKSTSTQSKSNDACCRRDNGDTILHCAINGEFFDLAFQIIKSYKHLASTNNINVEGKAPLHVLADKPSAFKSAIKLGIWKSIIYKCIDVKNLKKNAKPDETPSRIPRDEIKYPQNYTVLFTFFHYLWKLVKIVTVFNSHTKSPRGGDHNGIKVEKQKDQNPANNTTFTCFDFLRKLVKIETEKITDAQKQVDEENQGNLVVPKNYMVAFKFAKLLHRSLLSLMGPGHGWIISLRKLKEKHTWSLQVLNELLNNNNIYKFEDNGYQAPINANKNDYEDLNSAFLEAKKKEDPKYVKKKVVKKRETAMLIAARNGITEMVKRILEKFPVAIYDSNEDEKNVVLLALEYKQVKLYTFLLQQFSKNESIFRKVDKHGNGALHITAANTDQGNMQRWPIPGDALQMQWEIKWNKFVRNSMPENFFVEYNDKGETPETIFTKDHKNLVKSGSEWMSKTAESCSLVAALIATVAFATSTSLPGGTNEENGKPMLANQPAFRVFAVASLIALSFSVTSLVMFLTILTSRFSENNFEKILPWKLLMGLTSLFLAIVSMIIAFCAGHFFVLNDSIKVAAFPVYAVTAIPISFFAAAQFPLYVDLVFATFASPFGNPQNIIDPE